ncbi:hypothetical protein B566_EDAN012349, partial [Ephemera danica]
MNGTELQPLTRTEEALVTAPADPGAPNDNSEAELQWDPIGEGEELLGG